MIDKDSFKELISEYTKTDDDINALVTILGSGAIDNRIVKGYWEIFDKYLSTQFTVDGVDDILWWLHEKANNPEFKMWDKSGNEISTESIDDLWNIIKNSRI